MALNLERLGDFSVFFSNFRLYKLRQKLEINLDNLRNNIRFFAQNVHF